MKPSEMTTVHLLESAAEYVSGGGRAVDREAAAALRERATRLRNVLKVADVTGDPKEPFDNGRAAMFAAYELARKLNAPSDPPPGAGTGPICWHCKAKWPCGCPAGERILATLTEKYPEPSPPTCGTCGGQRKTVDPTQPGHRKSCARLVVGGACDCGGGWPVEVPCPDCTTTASTV